MEFQQGQLWQGVGETYTLIVNNDHLLNATIPAELIVQIPFGCANAQTEYTQHVARIRGLGNGSITNPEMVSSLRLTMGACEGRFGGVETRW